MSETVHKSTQSRSDRTERVLTLLSELDTAMTDTQEAELKLKNQREYASSTELAVLRVSAVTATQQMRAKFRAFGEAFNLEFLQLFGEATRIAMHRQGDRIRIPSTPRHRVRLRQIYEVAQAAKQIRDLISLSQSDDSPHQDRAIPS